MIWSAIGGFIKNKAKEKIASNMSENQGKTKGGIDLTPLENLKSMMKQDRGFYKHPKVQGMKQDSSGFYKHSKKVGNSLF